MWSRRRSRNKCCVPVGLAADPETRDRESTDPYVAGSAAQTFSQQLGIVARHGVADRFNENIRCALRASQRYIEQRERFVTRVSLRCRHMPRQNAVRLAKQLRWKVQNPLDGSARTLLHAQAVAPEVDSLAFQIG